MSLRSSWRWRYEVFSSWSAELSNLAVKIGLAFLGHPIRVDDTG